VLEAELDANSSPLITLYGDPGSSYLLLQSTNLLTGTWSQKRRIGLTNLLQTFEVDRQDAFYRAQEFEADPPIVEFAGHQGRELRLIMYGQKGVNYVLETTLDITSPATWTPAKQVLTTDSFNVFEIPLTEYESVFFRATRM
jgi:hypothetical protein